MNDLADILTGYVEVVSDRRISGWSCGRRVELVVNGKPVRWVAPNGVRPDCVAHGHANARSFVIDPLRFLEDGENHILLRDADTQAPLGAGEHRLRFDRSRRLADHFRFPSKLDVLTFLDEAGVDFGTIIDVGAHAETPELRTVFPDRKHVLFEPVQEFHPLLAQNYAGMDFELAPVAVSDVDGFAMLKKLAITGDEISHAKIESDATSENLVRIETVRLDSWFATRAAPAPFLLKIDVDGFELPVLRGAEGVWDRIDCVIIEATVDALPERLNFLLGKGFRLIDIVDQCYYARALAQVDLVFVSERLWASHPMLGALRREPFAWSKWVPVASFEAHVATGRASGG